VPLRGSFAVAPGFDHAGPMARDERAAEAAEGLDLIVTPTLTCVAPPAVTDDRRIVDALIRFTYPFNALGWPALALPCAPAEHGLPASVQLAGGRGRRPPCWPRAPCSIRRCQALARRQPPRVE
jgi:Asp-tRNA(Asn)/Glu-tRNA(Gln) amidotransferase A subunit family amidase